MRELLVLVSTKLKSGKIFGKQEGKERGINGMKTWNWNEWKILCLFGERKKERKKERKSERKKEKRMKERERERVKELERTKEGKKEI